MERGEATETQHGEEGRRRGAPRLRRARDGEEAPPQARGRCGPSRPGDEPAPDCPPPGDRRHHRQQASAARSRALWAPP